MGERFATRALVVSRAIVRSLGRRAPREGARRILVAHNLLLGDTIMLTPLLAKLRANDADAEITLLANPAFVPLYSGRPYGVRALPFKPADSSTAQALVREPPFDLAYVIGDNRYSWLAAAMRARHIVAHSGGAPWTKNVFVDEQHPYSQQPAPWGEMVATLAEGADPPPYHPSQWPAPPARPFDAPERPYAVLHVGASTPLKLWKPERWRALAGELEARGLAVAWSAGASEQATVGLCDPEGRHRSYAGKLDLAQMWHLISGASLLVAPDTGIAHLGRLVGTPTVALFGPGSATLCANGKFWGDAPWRAVGEDAFPCRDQRFLFGRRVEWVRRCGRTIEQCPDPRCMHAISVDTVLQAADSIRR